MKRLFVYFTCLLACCSLTAQNSVLCQYWFDEDYASHQEVYVSNSSMHWLADATALPVGLHKLNMHTQGANGQWSSPRSFLFMNIPTLQTTNGFYNYWFDEDIQSSQTVQLPSGPIMVDATALSAGLHYLSIWCKIGTAMRVERFLFYYAPDMQSANATYTYWFDNNESQSQSGALVSGTMMANASALAPGMHSITIVCKVGTAERIESHIFYKTVGNPDATDLTLNYRVDDGSFQTMALPGNSNMVTLNLDMTSLSDGIHTIDHFVTNGHFDVLSPLQTDTFVRSHITQYYTLTVLSDNPTMGTVSPGGTYEENSDVTIEAFANNGYHFTQWNDANTQNPRQIVLTSDTTFTAHFDVGEGIDDYDLSNLRINASNSVIYISGVLNQPVDVYDMTGKLIAHQNITDGITAIRVPSTGTYLVRIGESIARKVVVM